MLIFSQLINNLLWNVKFHYSVHNDIFSHYAKLILKSHTSDIKNYLVMWFKNCYLFIWQSTPLPSHKFILSSSSWFHFGRSSAPSCIKIPDTNWAIFRACEELQWCWLIWFEFLVPSKVRYLKENYIGLYSVNQHKRPFHSWMGWCLVTAGAQFQI